MKVTQITANVFQVTLPIVNVFLIDHSLGLILIDTGPRNSKNLIFDAIRHIGKQPEDLRYIILTHAHHDHSGSLADILKSVKAQVYASALCAEMIAKGIAFRPQSKFKRFVIDLITLKGAFPLSFVHIEPVKTHINIVQEGDIVPNKNGLQVIAAPGHTAEQIALFYPIKEALLFAADSAENLKHLKPAYAYQSVKINHQTLKKLIEFPFKKAIFGHGSEVMKEKFEKMIL